MTPPLDPTALTALADWHEKEAQYASIELNFDDEADGGPTARFHRQAVATLRALASPATPATAGQTEGERGVHGETCRKAAHSNPDGGYLHAADDDSPYLVDGVRYCGRCHYAI